MSADPHPRHWSDAWSVQLRCADGIWRDAGEAWTSRALARGVARALRRITSRRRGVTATRVRKVGSGAWCMRGGSTG